MEDMNVMDLDLRIRTIAIQNEHGGYECDGPGLINWSSTRVHEEYKKMKVMELDV